AGLVTGVATANADDGNIGSPPTLASNNTGGGARVNAGNGAPVSAHGGAGDSSSGGGDHGWGRQVWYGDHGGHGGDVGGVGGTQDDGGVGNTGANVGNDGILSFPNGDTIDGPIVVNDAHLTGIDLAGGD